MNINNNTNNSELKRKERLDDINKLKQQYEDAVKTYQKEYGDSSLVANESNSNRQVQNIEPREALNKIREIQRRFDREISRFDDRFSMRPWGFNDWGFNNSPFRSFFDWDIGRSMKNMRESMMSEIDDVISKADPKKCKIESWQDGDSFFMKMSYDDREKSGETSCGHKH